MIKEVKVNSPGESITEVEISKWFVSTGDYVAKDQVIGEIESEKVTLDIMAEEEGKVEIIIEAETTVKVGEVIYKIDTEAKNNAVEKEGQSPKKAPERKDLEREKTKDKEVAPHPQKEKDENLKEKEKNQSTDEESAQESTLRPTSLAKKLMKEYQLTGNDIIKGIKQLKKQDVETIANYLSHKEYDTDDTTKTIAGANNRERQTKKMSQLRKKISEHLVAAKNETAMLTTFNEVDMTNAIALRKKKQNQFIEKHGIKLGYMSLFTKAVTKSLALFPDVNAQIDNEEIVFFKYADIGIAVQTPKGLMVPVIRNAENMTLAQIEKQIKELAEKARNAKLTMQQMSGATFTITNGGIFGSLLSTPIINPPQAAILGMHNIVERPIALDGKVAIRPMMYIALSYDHRIIDGKTSVGFLLSVKQFIENPINMLLNTTKPENQLLDL